MLMSILVLPTVMVRMCLAPASLRMHCKMPTMVADLVHLSMLQRGQRRILIPYCCCKNGVWGPKCAVRSALFAVLLCCGEAELWAVRAIFLGPVGGNLALMKYPSVGKVPGTVHRH